MNAESELSRKLREWEQKSKKCELENEKLRKEVKDAVDKHHRSKQEFEELKDFLLNNEVGVYELIGLRYRDSCHQPPREMMTIAGSFRGGKRLDLRSRRQMRSGKL